jgi:hypothetical protein
MPSLDAASKDPCYMTVKLKPEVMKYVESDPNSKVNVVPSQQKKWLPANFRLSIDGMEDVCKHVTKIEHPSIKIKIPSDAGSMRQSIRVPGRVEYPNITFYIPESYGRDLFRWSKDTTWMKTPRNGTLEYLSSDNTPLFTLTFKGLGIFKISDNKSGSGSDKVMYTTMEMYCEDIRFKYDPAAAQ